MLGQSDLLPASQQAKVNNYVDRSSSNLSLDEEIVIELSSIVESLDIAKLGEGDIAAKELINIDSMEPNNETSTQRGNDKPIDNVVTKRSRPQAAIRTLQDYANRTGRELLLHNIEQLKQIMPSEPKQDSIMNFFAPK